MNWQRLVLPAGALAAELLLRWTNLWWAAALALGLWWWQRRGLEQLEQWLLAIALGSLVITLALNRHWPAQVLLLGSFWLWWWGRQAWSKAPRFGLWQAAGLEFISLTAIFSAAAIWHWATLIVLVLTYLTSLIIAWAFLSTSERATRALATAWALIVAEASYVFSVWLVLYVLPHDFLLIPQAAVVLTAVGYCFGSIYLAHTGSKLSRARLAEYAIIGLCLIVIVIAGTRWSGAV